MVFLYDIDPDLSLAVVTVPAVVEARDVAETISAIYLDPLWRAGFATIWDGSGITELHIDWVDLNSLVHVQRDHAHLAGSGVEAIVVTRAIDRSLALTYALLARLGPRRTRVVDSMAEAMLAISEQEQR